MLCSAKIYDSPVVDGISPKSAGPDDVPIARKTVSGSISWQLEGCLALNRMKGRHLPEPQYGHIKRSVSEKVLVTSRLCFPEGLGLVMLSKCSQTNQGTRSPKL